MVSFDLVRAAGRVWSLNAGMEYRLDVGPGKWLSLRGGLERAFPATRTDPRIPALVKGYGRTSPVLGIGYAARLLGRLFYAVDYAIDADLNQAIATVGRRHNVNISFEVR
jgi:hypothetical protein